MTNKYVYNIIIINMNYYVNIKKGGGDVYDIDAIINSMPKGAAILLKSIKLADGTEIKNAFIEERAPRIQGFIAIAIKRKAAENNSLEVEATKYISLSSITDFVIDNEVLARVNPSYFIPEPEVKVKR